MHSTVTQERRKFTRSEAEPRLEVDLLQLRRAIPANSLNLSQGGLCLRLEEMVEIHSLVRLRVLPEASASLRNSRPVECTGRVAWVIQRLDLRNAPPFLFDVGIEFVNPPAKVRHLLAGRGGQSAAVQRPATREKGLDPSVIRGRHYIPNLRFEPTSALRWHLVVSVEGVPCFSGHYPTGREALAAWALFKRRQARR